MSRRLRRAALAAVTGRPQTAREDASSLEDSARTRRWGQWLHACLSLVQGDGPAASAALKGLLPSATTEPNGLTPPEAAALSDALEECEALFARFAGDPALALIEAACSAEGFLPALDEVWGGAKIVQVEPSSFRGLLLGLRGPLRKNRGKLTRAAFLTRLREIRRRSDRRAPGAEDKVAVVYDGRCFYYSWRAKQLRSLDALGRLDFLSFHTLDPDSTAYLSSRVKPRFKDEIYAWDERGRIYGGFAGLRRLSWLLPTLAPWAPFFYLPGAARLAEALAGGLSESIRRRAPELEHAL